MGRTVRIRRATGGYYRGGSLRKTLPGAAHVSSTTPEATLVNSKEEIVIGRYRAR